MGVLLNVRNEIAPCADLRADVEKLRYYGEEKMSLTEELSRAAVIAIGGFVFARDRGEFCAEDEQRPDYRDDAEDEVGADNAQNFKLKIGLIGVLSLAGGDLRGG